MTGRAPSHTLTRPFGVLLIILTVATAPAEAGLLEKVKSFTKPRLPTAGLIKAIGDYTKGVLEEGTALVKEGLSGNVDAATYNRRADDFLDRKANLGVTAFLQDAAENLKLKVSNPLAGVKDTLGDTRLGRAAASVKEKLWATTAEEAETGVTTPNAQSGAIDPRIALDVQEEETEWYQAETGIMDETPLPQAEIVAHVDDNIEKSPESDWDASNRDLQANADERDPWADLDDSANEWEERAALDCTGPWVDIDCGDEYQGDNGPSDESDVAHLSDEAQGGTYQEAMDSLLGNEPASYSDEYSASDEGYEEALAQLEAEAAERERERLAAEAAEREHQARLRAEEAERERQARLAAAEAERERERQARLAAAERERREEANSYDFSGALLGAVTGGILRGLEDSGKIESGTSSAVAGIAGLSQDSNGGFASGLSQSLNALNAMNAFSSRTPSSGAGSMGGGGSNSCNGMNTEIERVTAKLNRNVGMCMTAREVKQVFTRAASYYQNNNCPAGLVQYSREMITWANQTERQTCN